MFPRVIGLDSVGLTCYDVWIFCLKKVLYVLAVVGVVGWKASDGGGREGTISVRNGGTTADAGENRALEAGQYKIDRIAMPLNPVTAAAWDRTVFNGSELGPKVAV